MPLNIKINAEKTGHDVIFDIIEELKKNGVSAEPSKIQILVKSKDGKEVDLTPDRLRIVFNQ